MPCPSRKRRPTRGGAAVNGRQRSRAPRDAGPLDHNGHLCTPLGLGGRTCAPVLAPERLGPNDFGRSTLAAPWLRGALISWAGSEGRQHRAGLAHDDQSCELVKPRISDDPGAEEAIRQGRPHAFVAPGDSCRSPATKCHRWEKRARAGEDWRRWPVAKFRCGPTSCPRWRTISDGCGALEPSRLCSSGRRSSFWCPRAHRMRTVAARHRPQAGPG